MRIGLLLCACLWAVDSAGGADRGEGRSLTVFVGTYTGKSRGIYSFKLDLDTARLEPRAITEGVKNPSFLALHPSGQFLYAVSEVDDYSPQGSGAVTAFSVDGPSGQLQLLNHASSGSAGPCHLVVDQTGSYVLVANYGGGSVASLPIAADGRVGPPVSHIRHQGSSIHPRRQGAPHAHSINLEAQNRFAVAADLGLDKVLVYRFDAQTGRLQPHTFPHAELEPGSGPRHLAIDPSNRHAYVINELTCTVTAFRLDASRGELSALETISTLPPGEAVQPGYSTAEVQVHPSGKFLYGSNRGHDSIVVYRIDPQTGALSYVENESTQGNTPRNFGIDPTGQYLLAANQGSDTMVVMRIDPQTGALEPQDQIVEVPTPVCVKFLTP